MLRHGSLLLLRAARVLIVNTYADSSELLDLQILPEKIYRKNLTKKAVKDWIITLYG